MNVPKEWIGGIASLPGWVSEENGEDYRPDILLWIDGDNGAVLGLTTERPENLLGMAAAGLESAMLEPMAGAPSRPTQIRVASEPLAGVLGEAFHDIHIVVGPTPELDGVMQAMSAGITSGEKSPWWHSSVSRKTLQGFHTASSGLYVSAPWKKVPNDSCVLFVQLPALGPQERIVSIVGQINKRYGFIVFDDLDSYRRYADLSTTAEDADCQVPRHTALAFQRGADLPRAARQEILCQGWQVADDQAYPVILQVEPDLTVRPVHADTIVRFEALAWALSLALENAGPWQQAWKRCALHCMTLAVETSAGTQEVRLSTRSSSAIARFEGSDAELLAALDSFDLSSELDSADRERLVILQSSLLARLDASEEAAQLGTTARGMALLVDHATNLVGLPITQLMWDDLEEILFDILPSKLTVPRGDAGALIDSLRAGYRWMLNRRPCQQAEDCLALLDDDAEDWFESELGNEAHFGPTKAVMMVGIESGFDMTTQEGHDGFMASSQANRLGLGPPDTELPDDAPRPGRLSRDPRLERQQKKKRKACRKATKQSRRRNR